VKRGSRSLALAAAALLFLAGVFHNRLLSAVGSYLVKADAPGPADIGLVLAGDSFGNRIRTGAELVRAGYVPKVLVSGPSGFYGFHECDLAIPFAVKAGYPESYFVHFENEARSTAQESQAAAAVLRQMGVHKVLLVTSDFHTRRAGSTFRATAPDLQFVVVAAPDQSFRADGWWRSREGRKTTLLEWMKTVATWFSL
jgi:uncharacterized SAM-binding protein YcdF (DUF218 family)